MSRSTILSSAGQTALQTAVQRLSELHYGSDAYARPRSPTSSGGEPSPPDSPTMDSPPTLRRARRAMSSPQHVQRIWILQEERRFEEGLRDVPWQRRESLDDSRRIPLAAFPHIVSV